MYSFPSQSTGRFNDVGPETPVQSASEVVIVEAGPVGDRVGRLIDDTL